MDKTCVFCGASGKMTSEHVLPNWLAGVGLAKQPVVQASGWLNRSPQSHGQGQPFQTKVKAVCAACNNGWMSALEQTACRVFSPIIRGESQAVSEEDHPALATWSLKTALVAMMVSSQEDRTHGYGLPAVEFADLYRRRRQRRPPDHVQVWLGRFSGDQHIATVQATPMIVVEDGLAEPDAPQAYVFSVLLGEMFLQGIRFTATLVEFDLATQEGLAQIWPVLGDVDWPTGDVVTDRTLRAAQKGMNLHSIEAQRKLLPYRPAVDLPDSAADGRLVHLSTPCGRHQVYYPDALVAEATRRRFYAFMTMCECPKAYLVQTESDGVHFKIEGSPEAIEEQYNVLEGEELVAETPDGKFFCKCLKPA